MKICITDEAETDIQQAYWFYEKQQKGLGSDFRETLLQDIDTLETRGGIHQVINGYHCLLASRFPFMVYYTLSEKTVIVIAILDSRRGPEWIENRLA